MIYIITREKILIRMSSSYQLYPTDKPKNIEELYDIISYLCHVPKHSRSGQTGFVVPEFKAENNNGNPLDPRHDTLSEFFDKQLSGIICEYSDKISLTKLCSPLPDWAPRINFGISTGEDEEFTLSYNKVLLDELLLKLVSYDSLDEDKRKLITERYPINIINYKNILSTTDLLYTVTHEHRVSIYFDGIAIASIDRTCDPVFKITNHITKLKTIFTMNLLRCDHVLPSGATVSPSVRKLWLGINDKIYKNSPPAYNIEQKQHVKTFHDKLINLASVHNFQIVNEDEEIILEFGTSYTYHTYSINIKAPLSIIDGFAAFICSMITKLDKV